MHLERVHEALQWHAMQASYHHFLLRAQLARQECAVVEASVYKYFGAAGNCS